MKRRSFLAALGLAPVAALVTPGKSHAEKLAEDRAAHPFMIARVPQHTSPEEREELLRQLEALTCDPVMVCDNTIEISFTTAYTPTAADAEAVHAALRETP